MGRVLLYDALRASFRTVTVRPDPAGTPVRELVDYDRFCGTDQPAAGTDRAVSADDLAVLLRAGPPVTVVDVREVAELVTGVIPGSRSVPLATLTEPGVVDALREAAAAGPLVVYCASGVRSARAVAELGERGVSAAGLTGGFTAWARGGHAVGTPSPVPVRT